MSNGGMEQAQGGQTAQGGTAGGDIKNMSVGELLNLANQQNIDVSALNDLLSNIQVNPDIGANVGTGDQDNEDQDQAQDAQNENPAAQPEKG